MPHLFDPLTLRGVTLGNRIVVSPMCQYSSVDGFANEWHLIHLASRAVGGAALVFTEAATVAPDGRISPQDLGIYDDAHVDGLSRVVRAVHAQGCLAGIQLAHAGRKGSTTPPWQGSTAVGRDGGGWQPLGPGDQPFSPAHPPPRAMTVHDIEAATASFGAAVSRALEAGFDVVEIHAAHGYLIHEFLSPLVNTRTDAYGGGFDNRARLCVAVVDTIRTRWPERLPLFVRISASDWKEGGWDVEQSVELALRLRQHGVDLIDCSSGGAVPDVTVPFAPGYQVPFAERIRRAAAIPTGAVGLITEPAQANAIIEGECADVVLLARELLRDPYWPLRAARELGHQAPWPIQYLRAAPPGTTVRRRLD